MGENDRREAAVGDIERPDTTCAVGGCGEPAVVTPRAPSARRAEA